MIRLSFSASIFTMTAIALLLGGCDRNGPVSGLYVGVMACKQQECEKLDSEIEKQSIRFRLQQDGDEVSGNINLRLDDTKITLEIENGYVDEQNYLYMSTVYVPDIDLSVGANLGIANLGISGSVLKINIKMNSLSPIEGEKNTLPLNVSVNFGGLAGMMGNFLGTESATMNAHTILHRLEDDSAVNWHQINQNMYNYYMNEAQVLLAKIQEDQTQIDQMQIHQSDAHINQQYIYLISQAIHYFDFDSLNVRIPE